MYAGVSSCEGAAGGGGGGGRGAGVLLRLGCEVLGDGTALLGAGEALGEGATPVDSSDPGESPRNTDGRITVSSAAAATAMDAIAAGFVRYHGFGAGLKVRVLNGLPAGRSMNARA